MVAVSSKLEIGMGVYTPKEAALYSGLRPATFNRWFFGNKQGKNVVRPRIAPDGGERVVAFWDLMQAVAIRNLRLSPLGKRVPLEHIREAVEACEKIGFSFPLARRHTLFVFLDRLILKLGEEYVGLSATADDKDQWYNKQIVEPFISDVSFKDDGMAFKWTPYYYRDFRVSLNSETRFGAPIVESSDGKSIHISVDALVDSIVSEGSVEAAADAYEVPVDAVLAAKNYLDNLSGPV